MMMQQTVKIKNNIATSGEGFIFNPATGDSFSTNPIGNQIIAMLKAGDNLDEIKAHICSGYDVDEDQFDKDLDDFISQLKEFTILD